MTKNIKKKPTGIPKKRKIENKSEIELDSVEVNEKYIPLSGTLQNSPVIGTLTFDGIHLIKGLPEAKIDNEVVIKKQIITFIKKEFEKRFVLKSSPEFSGPLTFQFGQLINLGRALQDTDAVNFIQVKDNLALLVPKIGNSSDNPLKVSLNFNGKYTVKNMGDPKEAADAVNLRTLQAFVKEELSSYLPLTGGQAGTDFKIGRKRIMNLADPLENADAVNLKTIKSFFNQYIEDTDRITYAGNSLDDPVRGTRIMANGCRISGLRDPLTHSEAITARYLNNTIDDMKIKFLCLKDNTFTGHLNMNGKRIRNVQRGVIESDGAILEQALERLTELVPLTGNLTPLQVPLIFNGLSTFKNFKDAEMSDELIFAQTFRLLCEGYLRDEMVSLDIPVIQSDLNFDGNKCTNIGPVSVESALISLGQAQDYIDQEFSCFPSSKRVRLEDDLHMNSCKITNLKDAKKENDLINLRCLKNIINSDTESFLKKSGGLFPSQINACEYSVINLGDATEDSDILNVRSLKKFINENFSKEKELRFQNNLVFDNKHTVVGFKKAEQDDEVINLDQFKEIFSNKISLRNKELTQNIILDGQAKIKGLAEPIREDDGVSLKTLNSMIKNRFTDYLPSIGGSLNSTFRIKGSRISLENTPSLQNDAVNKKYLTDKIKNYLNSSETNAALSGNFYFNSAFGIRNLDKAIEDDDMVTQENLIDLTSILIDLNAEDSNIIDNDLYIKDSGKVSGIPSAIDDHDPISLRFLSSYLDKSFSEGTLPVRIDASGFSVSNLSNPIYGSDVVNLKTLNEHDSEYLSLQGTSSENPLRGHFSFNGRGSISFSNESREDGDAVNLTVFDEIMQDAVPMTFQSPLSLQGNLEFNHTRTITNLGSPLGDSDLINLETTTSILKEGLEQYLNLSGGRFENDLDLKNHFVKGLPFYSDIDQTSDNESLSLKTLQNYSDNFLVNFTSSSDVSFQETIHFDGEHTIFGLKKAPSSYDAVNFQQVQDEFFSKLTLLGNNQDSLLKSSIHLDSGHSIINHKDPENDDHPVTLKFAQGALEDLIQKEAFLDTKGGNIDYPLDASGFTFINIADPEKPEDILNNRFVDAALDGFLPLNKPVCFSNGRLDFSSLATIKNTGDANLPEDGLNLRSLKKCIRELSQDFILKTAPSFKNNLTILSGDVTNIGSANNDNDVISYGFLKQEGANSLSVSGNTQDTPFKGVLRLDAFHTITSEGIPAHDDDLINLRTAKQFILNASTEYVSSYPCSIKGTIDMRGHCLKQLPNPTEDTNIVSKAFLSSYIEKGFENDILTKEGVNKVRGVWNLNGNQIRNIITLSDNHVVSHEALLSLLEDRKRIFIKTEGDHRIQGTLNFNQNSIDNVKDAEAPEDVVNLRTLNKQIDEFILNNSSSFFNPKTGILDDELNLQNTQIRLLRTGEEKTDLVNSGLLAKSADSYCRWDTFIAQTFTGNVTLDGASVCSGFAEGVDDGDAVSLGQGEKYIRISLNNRVKSSKAIFGNDVDMGGKKILNISDPIKPEDAVNLKFLENKALSYLINDDSDSELPLQLFFLENCKIRQTALPTDDGDSVNVKTAIEYIDKFMEGLLLKTGGNVVTLDAAKKNIINLKDPKNDHDVINLKKLNDELNKASSKYVSLSSENLFDTDLNLNGNVILNLGYHSNNDNDAVNLISLKALLNGYTHLHSEGQQIENLTFDGKSTIRSSLMSSTYSGVSLKNCQRSIEKFIRERMILKEENLHDLLPELHMENNRITNVAVSTIPNSAVPLTESHRLRKEMPRITSRKKVTSLWCSGAYLNPFEGSDLGFSDRFCLSADKTGIRFLFQGVYLITISFQAKHSAAHAELTYRTGSSETVICSFLCPKNETASFQAILPIVQNDEEGTLSLRNIYETPCSYESFNWGIQRLCDSARN